MKKEFVLRILVMALVLGITIVGNSYAQKSGADSAKSVKVENITGLTGQAGVWVYEVLNSYGRPENAAIKTGSISKNALSVNLMVPKDNTFEGAKRWAGKGDYYVAIVPIRNNAYNSQDALVFTNGGNDPVKVAFNEALVTLDFGKFKKPDSSQPVKVENITGLTGDAGVWVYEKLDDYYFPRHVIGMYGFISENTLSIAWKKWTGNGDFYVDMIPIRNNTYQTQDTLVFTNGGNDPVKVTFDGSPVTLDFEKFRKPDSGQPVKVENITGLTGRAGVWVFVELGSKEYPKNGPINTAIMFGNISGNALSVDLSVPKDNTWTTGNKWTGSGAFYVAIVPMNNIGYLYNKALVFTDGGTAPVKVTFDGQPLTLDFRKFKNMTSNMEKEIRK